MEWGFRQPLRTAFLNPPAEYPIRYMEFAAAFPSRRLIFIIPAIILKSGILLRCVRRRRAGLQIQGYASDIILEHVSNN
jgi:hypothetical protein